MKKHAYLESTFEQYKQFILTDFMKEYGPSYMTMERFSDEWHKTVRYSPAAKEFLIRRSKLFTSTMSRRNPANTNPNFLELLTVKMAEFLAPYAAYSEHQATMSENIAKAQENLQIQLYNNSEYIQNLIERQQNAKIKLTSREKNLAKKAEKHKKALAAREMHRQIFAEFRDAAYKKKY